MIIITAIISFLLDGIILSINPLNSSILPLFTLLSLLVLYPYYCHDKRKMYVITIIMGMLYDIVYTNSLFLNTLVFVLLTYLIDCIFKLVTINFINTFLVATVNIILYRIIIYSFFVILGLINWNTHAIVDCIICSLVINYMYTAFIYFVLYIISKRLHVKRNV